MLLQTIERVRRGGLVHARFSSNFSKVFSRYLNSHIFLLSIMPAIIASKHGSLAVIEIIKEENARCFLKANGKMTGVTSDIESYNEMLEIIDDYYCQKEYDRVKEKTDAEMAAGDFVMSDELIS
jgi:hypothetical protein